MVKCGTCKEAKGIIKRPSTGNPSCLECFYVAFESQIHKTISQEGLFRRGEKIAIGASGGKDSTVLAYTLKLLNDRHDYGVELFLLSIDEGIAGYRDDSLATVHRNKLAYGLPLTVLSYSKLYGGWTMDAIVKRIGLRNNCTFCGVFRRQALERGARLLKCDAIATGHNADDMAETVLMNLMRGDHARLGRCTAARTNDDEIEEGTTCSNHEEDMSFMSLPRLKPFKQTHEKEIVMYAYFKRLEYFSTECPYAPRSFRGHLRDFLKQLERVRPTAVLDIIASGDTVATLMARQKASSSDKSCSSTAVLKKQVAVACERCGFMTSAKVCKPCLLLQGLNDPDAQAPKILLGIHKQSSLSSSSKDENA